METPDQSRDHMRSNVTSLAEKAADRRDKELFAQYANHGNQHAFNKLFNTHTRPMKRWLVKIKVPHEDAEEIVNMAWRDLTRNPFAYKPREDAKFKTYLYRLLINRLKKHIEQTPAIKAYNAACAREIGATVKNMRETAHMSKETLANLIGCTTKNISDIESGFESIKDSDIAKLADVFSVNNMDFHEAVKIARARVSVNGNFLPFDDAFETNPNWEAEVHELMGRAFAVEATFEGADGVEVLLTRYGERLVGECLEKLRKKSVAQFDRTMQVLLKNRSAQEIADHYDRTDPSAIKQSIKLAAEALNKCFKNGVER